MKYYTECLAFYNLENLFDIYDDEEKLDDDFLPVSKRKWSKNRYHKKLQKLAIAIYKMGNERTGKHPIGIGLAEVENKEVIQDLLQTAPLKDLHYDYIHFDSPDERGIDVAFLYDKQRLQILDAEPRKLHLQDDNGTIDYTRDMLLLKARLDDEIIYLLVCHWPSKRNGSSETDYKRAIAGTQVVSIFNELKAEDPKVKFICMGDLNSNPDDAIFREDLPTSDALNLPLDSNLFFNPMHRIFNKGAGSLNYKGRWNLFDQFILSPSIAQEDNYKNFQFYKARIFDARFLQEWKGKAEGSPFRTYKGRWYAGGYSDHFPILIYISKIFSISE